MPILAVACHTCGKDLSEGHLWCHVCARMFCGPCRDKDRAEHEGFKNHQYWGLR